MTTSRIVAAEISWPIVIEAGSNNLVVDLTVSGVSTSYNVALTPGTYWNHKLKTGLPGCFVSHIAARIQAVTGQTTQAQSGIQLKFGGSTTGPAWRFIHTNPAVTASAILVLDPGTTVPKDYLGWHYNDAAAGQWSEHLSAGSFVVVDKAYSNAFRNTRIVEWRPFSNSDISYMHGSPNAIRGVSDIRRTVSFEASGVAAPYVNGALFDHAPTLTTLLGNVDLAESAGSSLSDLWSVNPDNLRYYVQLDNVSNRRHWWAPCRIENDIIEDASKWRSDEGGYPGEHHRVRIPLRLTSDMTAVI